MKIGVFSDVHGNLEALEVCLARLKKEKVEGYINCGDIIGYGPDSEACVATVMTLPNIINVMGNHDAIFVQPDLEDLFNNEAKVSLEDARKTLHNDSVRFLSSLPVIARKGNYTVVHGTPADPIREYFTSVKQFRSNYTLWEGEVCFVGQTHLSFYMRGTEQDSILRLNKAKNWVMTLEDKFRYVINPGAVGRPRDNDPAASFGIWDTEEKTFAFIREPYDFSITQRKMKERGYPPFLVDGLGFGM